MLDLKNLDLTFRRKLVPVPEMADTPAGEPPPSVVVRELTASERRAAIRRAQTEGKIAYFDHNQIAYLGTVKGDEKETGKGRRFFKSESYVGDLPGRYHAAIVRIGNAILELSGLTSSESGAEQAKKN